MRLGCQIAGIVVGVILMIGFGWCGVYDSLVALGHTADQVPRIKVAVIALCVFLLAGWAVLTLYRAIAANQKS